MLHLLVSLLVLGSAPHAAVLDSGLLLEPLASPAGAHASLPNLVRGADGEIYLSWVERLADHEARLCFSTFGTEGWSEAREILRAGDLFLNWADFPSLCVLADGRIMAQWLRSGDDPHGYSAEFSISADGGATWSAPRRLHDHDGPGEHGFVSLVAMDHETFGAFWLDGRKMVGAEPGAGEMAAMFRSISADGELGEEQIVDSRVCSCCQTSLVRTPSGGLLAAYRDRSAGEVRDIAFSQTVAGVAGWRAPELVHDDGWFIPGCPVNGPRLVAEKEVGAAVWFTGAGEGGGSVFLARRLAKGPGYGPVVKVDDGLPMGRVDLVPLAGGGLLVAWLEHTESGAEWRLRRSGAGGLLGESLAAARVPAQRASGYLRMVAFEGGALMAWTQGGAEPGIGTLRVRSGH
ncbi:MAG: exo-alpha-sialidase [bacterium]|jgi:hypothetical protein